MISLVSSGGEVIADLWTTAQLELVQLCRLLCQRLGIGPFQHDYENVWEWGYGQVDGGQLEVNVTRKHEDGKPLFEEPIRVMLLVPAHSRQDWVDRIQVTWLPRIGQVLADTTGAIAYSGRWRYLLGNDFDLEVHRVFAPVGGSAA